VTHLKAAVLEQETSEVWSDPGFVYMAAGKSADAEGALCRALELDPVNIDAAAKLGKLLIGMEHWPATLAILEEVLPRLTGADQVLVLGMIDRCHAQVALTTASNV
jgi:Tfp pilus assembly protein PilF